LRGRLHVRGAVHCASGALLLRIGRRRNIYETFISCGDDGGRDPTEQPSMPIQREFDFDRRRMRSPYLRMLFDYWEGLRGDRVAPDASEIDPLQMPPSALPHVILIDLEQNPLRARYRLVGTHSTEAAGWDYTGKYVHELDMPNTMMQEVMEDFAFALAKQAMYANYEWPMRDNRGIVKVELIQLPLLENGIVTRCFSGEHVGLDEILCAEDMMPITKTVPIAKIIPLAKAS
jgi:hypothetical protein